MTSESSNRILAANDLLRRRAMAASGKNGHPSHSPRLADRGPQRRQVQMGEVLKPQQHA